MTRIRIQVRTKKVVQAIMMMRVIEVTKIYQLLLIEIIYKMTDFIENKRKAWNQDKKDSDKLNDGV